MTSSTGRSVSLLAVAALAIGAAAWWLLGGGGGESAEVVDAGTITGEEAAAGSPVSADLANVSEPEEGERTTVEVEPAPHVDDASVEPEDAPFLLVAGTVVPRNPSDFGPDGVTGSFDAVFWHGNSGSSVDVEVENGAFEVLGTTNDEGDVFLVGGRRSLGGPIDELEFSIDEFETGDGVGLLVVDRETGVPHEYGHRYPAGARDLELVVELPRVLVLNVVDAANGAPLVDVEVVHTTGRGRFIHPMGQRRSSLAENARSPVEIRPSSGIVTRREVPLAVRARGYAWSPITVDFEAGGERTIELAPAASLVAVMNPKPPAKASLRLRNGSGSPVFDVELKGKDRLEIEALEPSSYRATVELGPWYDKPIVLAEERFDLAGGDAATVTFDLEMPDAAQHATAAGRIFVPTEWSTSVARLSLERLTPSKTGAKKYDSIRASEISAVTGEPGRFTFEKDGLEVGKYALSYPEFDYKIVFELPPEGRSDIVFEVPPPALISIVTVDADTGLETDEIESLHWHPSWPDGAWGGSLESISRDAESGRFEARVPACSIDVSTTGGTWSGNLTIEDPLADALVQMEVRRRASVIVDLRCGETRVPWPSDHHWDIEAVEGEGICNTSGHGNGERWFGVSEPGLYRVKIPEIDGYMPLDPVEIELEAGKRKRFTVELVRR